MRPARERPSNPQAIDVAYQLLLFERRRGSGNANPAVDGTYRTANQALVVSFRQAF